MNSDPQSIREQVRRLKETQPGLRARDIALALAIPEGVLVASSCGDGTTRLSNEFPEQFAALGSLGEVMALTRNAHAVIEKVGMYQRFEHLGHASQVLGDAIDLRLFFNQFRAGFAVTEQGPRGEHRSLQYFDEHGDAVHKIHLRAASDVDAFQALIARFRAADQSPVQTFSSGPAPSPERADAEIDLDGFRAAYRNMQNTHELFGILRSFGVKRHQALRLLGPEFARPVERLALRGLLREAATAALPIMLFVGSRGVIQIHSGPVVTLKQYGDWWNVMDPGFNLHLHEPGIAGAWVVKKPTAEGLVSSLELYDAQGEALLLTFSKRPHGQEETALWRALLAQLPDAGQTAPVSVSAAAPEAHPTAQPLAQGVA